MLYYKRNKNIFSVLIYSYINTRENWKNSKLCGNCVFTQFRVFPIFTSVDITVYQHGKCFIFLKYNQIAHLNTKPSKFLKPEVPSLNLVTANVYFRSEHDIISLVTRLF